MSDHWDELKKWIARRETERTILLKVAANCLDLCFVCENNSDEKEKPCGTDDSRVCGETCNGCRCASCHDGSEWKWNGKEAG